MRLIGSVLVIALSLSVAFALTIFTQPRPVSEYTCLQVGDQLIDLRTGAVSQGEPLPTTHAEKPHRLSDGRYFTFERLNPLTDQDATLAHFYAADDTLIRTYRLPHRQGAPKPNYYDILPAPNNKYLALWWMDNSSGFPIGQLMVLDLAGEQLWEVTRRLPYEGRHLLTWHADSSRLYYFYLLDRGLELRGYDLSTAQSDVLARRIRSDRFRTLSRSPDQRRFVLGLEDGQPDRLVLLTLDGSQPPLTLMTGFGGYRVTWASDSSAFAVYFHDQDRRAKAFFVRVDGQFISSLAFDGYLSWSPNARYILYIDAPSVRGAAQAPGTYLHDLAGGATVRLARNDLTNAPLWSPDGMWVGLSLRAPYLPFTIFQIGSGHLPLEGITVTRFAYERCA
ncbi:MAG: hypothetical protein DYG88_00515 [Chloroflexi bacterium CFX4]|nr:hypothetical protein [Chloroflexi bacterium CFX4]MDL1921618.1 hypothetical protein [Chloroflexi bacterium CFX3]